jgi:predicted nucleic acid-binding protein
VRAEPLYLADTSVHVLRRRYSPVAARYEELLAAGRLAVCQMTALEYLNNAPDPQSYRVIAGALRDHRWLDVDTAAMDRALAVHGMLAAASQHRNFALPDLIIAATAELQEATVLHYDADYDRIATVTGQPTEWVAPRGSL